MQERNPNPGKGPEQEVEVRRNEVCVFVEAEDGKICGNAYADDCTTSNLRILSWAAGT